MKRITTALTISLLTLSAFSVQARNVTENEAKTAAANYMTQFGRHGEVDPAELTLIHQIDNPDLGVPACYFFNVSDWGWIVMAGSTATDPVVAVADRGETLDTTNMAPAMLAWLDDYAGFVSFIQNNDMKEPLAEDDRWAKLTSNDSKPASKRIDKILLNSSWSQGEPDGIRFNGRCPKVDGVYCVAGCVNTALAQILYYYKFPSKPIGSVSHYWKKPNGTYEWLRLNYDTMRIDYSLLSDKITRTASAAKRNESSKLCYAIGVSMGTTYNTAANGGSGAYSEYAITRMYENFKYKRATQIFRSSMGDNGFVSQIREELMNNRPVYMSGRSSTGYGNDFGGHAWVCAGYRDNQDGSYLYYMNWGWGGESSGDGFFNLQANTQDVGAQGMRISNTGDAYTFNLGQAALIGLVPEHPDSTAVNFNVGINTVQNTNLMPAYPNPATHTVAIPYSTNEPSSIMIYNIEGRHILTQPVGAGSGEAVVNIERMPAGIYIYRLGAASGKFIVR